MKYNTSLWLVFLFFLIINRDPEVNDNGLCCKYCMVGFCNADPEVMNGVYCKFLLSLGIVNTSPICTTK